MNWIPALAGARSTGAIGGTWLLVWLLWWPRIQFRLHKKYPRLESFLDRTAKHNPVLFLFETYEDYVGHDSLTEKATFPLKAIYPAPEEMLDGASAVARSWWSEDNPKRRTVHEWYKKNGRTTCVVRDSRNYTVGYFDFFPVTEAFAKMLEAGVVDEDGLIEHLLADNSLNDDDPFLSAKHFYVGGIALSRPLALTHEAREISAFLIYMMKSALFEAVLKMRGADESIVLHAVAFTDLGRAACKGNKFKYVRKVGIGLMEEGEVGEEKESEYHNNRLVPSQYFRRELRASHLQSPSKGAAPKFMTTSISSPGKALIVEYAGRKIRKNPIETGEARH